MSRRTRLQASGLRASDVAILAGLAAASTAAWFLWSYAALLLAWTIEGPGFDPNR